MSKLMKTLNGYEPKDEQQLAELEYKFENFYGNSRMISDPQVRRKYDLDQIEKTTVSYLNDSAMHKEGKLKYS